MDILGIDIGGSGIKAAPVDTETGKLSAARCRFRTPSPATPETVGATIAELVKHFAWDGPIGCGFPAVVRHGRTLTASNVAPAWVGYEARSLFEEVSHCAVTVINDADAAGYAEMCFGAGRGAPGVVLIVTLGTGIGTALFSDGHLVPNTGFGHIEIKGKVAEKWAAASVREQEELGWKKWAQRLNTYLVHMDEVRVARSDHPGWRHQ